LNCKFEFRTRRTNPGSPGAALGGSLRYPNGIGASTHFVSRAKGRSFLPIANRDAEGFAAHGPAS
jgi:hypothetical protein